MEDHFVEGHWCHVEEYVSTADVLLFLEDAHWSSPSRKKHKNLLHECEIWLHDYTHKVLNHSGISQICKEYMHICYKPHTVHYDDFYLK